MIYVLLLPFYYGLVSAAAWFAVVELVRAPEQWNKTEHGLSRTSRSGRLTRVGAGRPSQGPARRPEALENP